MSKPTIEERAAFDLEQIRAMADLSCSHDQAWIDAVLANERKSTAQRISRRFAASVGGMDVVRSILDDELGR